MARAGDRDFDNFHGLASQLRSPVSFRARVHSTNTTAAQGPGRFHWVLHYDAHHKDGREHVFKVVYHSD